MNTVTANHEISYAGEVKRKAIHLFALVIPLGYFIVPFWWAFWLLLIAWLVSLGLDVIRLLRLPPLKWTEAVFGTVLRPQEERDFTGATYILFSGLFCHVAFVTPAAAAGMGFIILGDTAAALVGRRWGRHRFGNKSFEGSTAFFICAAVCAVLVPGIPLGWGFGAAFLATVVEATSGLIDDNVSVPLVTGAFLHYVPALFT